MNKLLLGGGAAGAAALLGYFLGRGGDDAAETQGQTDGPPGAPQGPGDRTKNNPPGPSQGEANQTDTTMSDLLIRALQARENVSAPTLEINIPEELRERGPDPAMQAYVDLAAKTLDPRYQALVGDQNLERQKDLNRQTAELSLMKQRQMDKRLLEQENIRAWRDTYRATVEANAKMALGTAQAIANAMTPNQGFMKSITEAASGAQNNAAIQGLK